MLRFASETAAACNAGEALLAKYRDADFGGVCRSMQGRQFALLVWDSVTEYVDAVATIGSDATGDYAQWVLSGSTSEALRGKSGLFFEIAEQLLDGRDTITSGTLVVNSTAPTVAANSSAPAARWITCLTRSFDPVFHSVTPIFHITYEAFGTSGVPTFNVSTDFSSSDHTLTLLMA
jgi:hypothetical protein